MVICISSSLLSPPHGPLTGKKCVTGACTHVDEDVHEDPQGPLKPRIADHHVCAVNHRVDKIQIEKDVSALDVTFDWILVNMKQGVVL